MQAILQHLFKKNTLQEIPVEKLQQVTNDFPFFAVGQLLLTKKLKELDDPAYEEQFQKSLTYFHNPLWLQYQLSHAGRLETTPQSFVNGNTPSIEASDSIESNSQVELSHDLVETVVLNQENGSFGAETKIIETEPPLEAHSVDLINGSGDHEKQTIQREEPFTFQAYYTIDYFASQGIKLNADSQQQDKLGKQLKSFTEWLKTMRRLPETSVVEVIDKIKEGEIAQIAANSLEEKEILTEAMAEVLVKQGQAVKARDVYTKLSLQNPHKSPYFAAKIDELKLN